ncbi:hypothetical protein SERLADRAFT_451253 [Serpula lacrymans var. lacrymans S7.9]|uniref:Uncharacterized protein n=2 Tax=Serpula lacrymans var. lacrymans TaxID=341189 RepID=F8P2L4_SERL9|nr:uncharacterized protein SERLADRAFT_451253 [Serpula lacrymans var. lacrymans S7.9]EGO22399.1 hypothetical protein SERLADRAFT_451253 [Serpula lacrymans var. lacrymans S7.9]
MEELLEGLKSRYEELDQPLPQMVIVDNCCHVRSAVNKAMPDAQVGLDVFHFIMRYLAAILNGTRNPQCSAVAHDISKAILSSRASGHGESAKYRTKEEQEVQLQTMFEKWAEKGGVWSAAASKVHADQLAHVKKGCLMRVRQDIRSDGSRIEGSHKAWNGIMRSFASGLEMFLALGFDFVIRRNIRIRFRSQKPSKFLSSIHGTHHIRLANHIANSWNSLLSTEPTHSNNSQELKARPVLSSINTKESFGLGPSNHSSTFGGLIEVKTEADFDEQDLSLDQLVLDAEIEPTSILQCLDIDPNLLTPSTSNIISMFFAPGSKTVAPKCPSDKHTSQNLMAAFSPLADPNLNGLSRSQRIFSISTGIDPRSLTLNSSAEFFLFMDMRLQNKWASFSMTSRKWVLATADYNSRLEKLPKSGGSPAVMKNPRALFDKLGEIETKIVERIKSNNFVSSSGNEKFWRTHCFIVQLVKGENTDLKSRKTQICSRCRTIKYPGSTGFSGNHKKLFCSDGVPVRKDFPDELPP